MTFTFGSLFSGIGGIDLGLERAGMQCKWQVEIDEYAQKVLTKHWPNVTRFRDIKDCGAHNLAGVDCIAGGFPCQDISSAGRRAGITGERSGLWSEFYRLIRELRPRYVLVENVAALLYPIRRDGHIEPAPISTVLGDLAEGGYDAEWQILSAASVGAPHIRERVFIVAYATSSRHQEQQDTSRLYDQPYPSSDDVSNAAGDRCDGRQYKPEPKQLTCTPVTRQNGEWEQVADPTGDRWQSWRAERQRQQGEILPQWSGPSLADADSTRRQELNTPDITNASGQCAWRRTAPGTLSIFRRKPGRADYWRTTESDIRRVAHGVPRRVDRLRGLGNAVVPQVAEYVGRCILESEFEA